jgi:predicted nucleic acid-binding protein
MARYFVDTSALVKLYRNESLTTEVEACIAPGDTLVISGITSLEFQSAFFSLVRQKLIREAHALQRFALLRQDLEKFAIVPLTQVLVVSAEILIGRFGISKGLRPADALQLSCAIEANRQSPLNGVLTMDVILAQCAVASGLVAKPERLWNEA